MSRISLYIGMSLDGYIADENGDVDWMLGDGSDPKHPGTYEEFLNTVDAVVMGRRTYDQIQHQLSPNAWPYPKQEAYVMTHNPLKDKDNIHFINQTVSAFLHELKQGEHKHIWLCGGAQLVQDAIKADMIDYYHISILPIILGKGVRLFKESFPLSLELVKTETYNGIVDLVYKKGRK